MACSMTASLNLSAIVSGNTFIHLSQNLRQVYPPQHKAQCNSRQNISYKDTHAKKPELPYKDTHPNHSLIKSFVKT
ncbi:hypothetical protein ALT721_2350022 [Alteromonas alvinellae]